MRVLQRAYWRIRNQKSKTILVFGLITVVLSMLLISSAINNSVDQAIKQTKERITSEIYLNYNFEKMIEDKAETVKMDDQMVAQIEKLKNVKGVKRDTILPVKSDLKQVTSKEYDEMMNGDSIKVNPELENLKLPTNQIFGLDNQEDDEEFTMKKAVKTEGIFPYDSKDENATMISEEYAKKNNLQIGDFLTVNSGEGMSKQTQLKIVGLFKTNEVRDNKNPLKDDPYANLVNKFFMKKKDIQELSKDKEGNSSLNYTNLVIQVNSIDNIKSTMHELKKSVDAKWDYLQVSSDFEEFERITASIANIKKIATLILIVTIIAGLLILSLVMFLTIKDRKFEIGLLLSIGESKWKVWQQIILESLLVFLLSFLCSMVLSTTIAGKFSQYLMENNETVTTESTENKKTSNIVVSETKKEVKKQKEITDLKVDVTNISVLLFSFTTGIGILLFSVIIAVGSILKKDPQKILLDNN